MQSIRWRFINAKLELDFTLYLITPATTGGKTLFEGRFWLTNLHTLTNGRSLTGDKLVAFCKIQ